MADRIEIDFTANTREVTKGTDEIADALEDTERALGDVGAAGEDAGRSTSDALDDIASSADAAGDSVADGTGGAFDELASKADDALGETGTQLLGLVGIAGGVGGAVAAGVGFAVDQITSLIGAQIEQVQQLRDSIIEAYGSGAEAGRTFLDQATILNNALAINSDPTRFAAAAEAAKQIGVDTNTYILSQAGSVSDLNVVLEAARQAYEQVGVASGTGSRSAQAEAIEEKRALEGIIAANETLLATHEEGREAAQNAQSIRTQLSEAERAQIQRTRDAEQARWEAYSDAVAAVPNAKNIVVTADTGPAESALAGLTRARSVRITADVYTRDGQKLY